MGKMEGTSAIRLRGVRHNNLKNFDCDLPLRKLVVITGLSGSGKSSFAFDTLYAEGQRRYIETFSPYARQFFDRMDKPQVDRIEGIPPAIALEQRNSVKTTRSTVGTMTELTDFMKVLWTHLAHLYCRQCGKPVRKETPSWIWEQLLVQHPGEEVLMSFELPVSEKLSLPEMMQLLARQGYQRLLVPPAEQSLVLHESGSPYAETSAPKVLRLEECDASTLDPQLKCLTVVQDRLRLEPTQRSRFVDSAEQAFHFGKGKLTLRFVSGPRLGEVNRFSNRYHCAACDLDYREPTPSLFSFNHPLGACPTCRGFGRTITIDLRAAMPDWSKTLEEGVVRPWLTGTGEESQHDLLKFCKKRKVRTNVPFKNLPKEVQDWVIEGDPGYGKDADHEWPKAWYGVRGYFRWLESKAYKMHVRVLLARYRAYTTCQTCNGKRLQPDALQFQMEDPERGRLSLPDFYQLPVRDSLKVIQGVQSSRFPQGHPLHVVLQEVRNRLSYLFDVGLGYLTLDRSTRTLSGGETQRVNLTTSLGTRLVNTLYVLDEPSVGLHPVDTHRVIQSLERLRDLGNTVVVVEHEASMMKAADQILDLGPGQGERGGHIVFQGSYAELLKTKESITGAYLSKTREVPIPTRRPVSSEGPCLELSEVNLHNLRDLKVRIPLNRLVCVTGVSGSGKSTLVREVLVPLLLSQTGDLPPNDADDVADAEETEMTRPTARLWLHSGKKLDQAIVVDQSLLGRTPRSNPAVYMGAFDGIRELFARSPAAEKKGLTSSSFSFNSKEGQCETCRGTGFEKIEMQFLSDVFIRCPECDGKRYRPHILEVELQGKNIAGLLESTVEEAIEFLVQYPEVRALQDSLRRFLLLRDVGLGYLRLGQPINTLSGGESQRLKLASHLAEQKPDSRIFFLFDEPTTGLHFEDVRILMEVFQKLVNQGHSVLVIEHNLDVIKGADWVVDLGPGAGDEGGRVVCEGTPEQVAREPRSFTGQALQEVLP